MLDLGHDLRPLGVDPAAGISRVAGPTDEPRNNSLLSLPAFVSHKSRFDCPGYASRSPYPASLGGIALRHYHHASLRHLRADHRIPVDTSRRGLYSTRTSLEGTQIGSPYCLCGSLSVTTDQPSADTNATCPTQGPSRELCQADQVPRVSPSASEAVIFWGVCGSLPNFSFSLIGAELGYR